MSFRIFHFADIHIVEKRIDEYIDVLLQFYDKIKESKLPNFVTIAGDIFDNKVSLKPAEIMLFNDMIQTFLEFNTCVLVMPGNHDCNMNDPNATDLITPLLGDIKHPNLHFFPRPSVKEIEFKSIKMCVHAYSPINKNIVMPTPPKNSPVFQLAIVHEIIMEFHGNKPRLDVAELSKNYDLVVCGDVHKHEFLAPNVAYCGSFVQQNIGEHPLEHGYIDWTITSNKDIDWTIHPGKKVTGRHVPLTNLLGSMLKVYLLDNKLLKPDLIDEVKKAQRINIEYINCTPEFVESIKSMLKAKYHINIERVIDKTKYQIEEIKAGNKADDPDHTFAKLLVDHMSTLPEGKSLIRMHNDIMQTVPSTSGHQWRPIYMEWTNMFGYSNDEKHWVNFNYISDAKTFGITGNNKVGKSTIFDIMQFLLWNECDRGSLTMVMNNRSVKYSCMIIIQSENKNTYVINRDSGADKKPKVSLSQNGINITKTDINKTYAAIEEIVGPYQNFCLITHQMSDSQTFTSMSREKQKQYVTTLLGLDEVNTWKIEAKRRCKTDREVDKLYGPKPKFATSLSITDRLAQAKIIKDKLAAIPPASITISQFEAYKSELKLLPMPPHGIDPRAELASISGQTSTPTSLSIENVQAELQKVIGAPDTTTILQSINKFMHIRSDDLMDPPPLTLAEIEAKMATFNIANPQERLDDLKSKLRYLDPPSPNVPQGIPNTYAAYKEAQKHTIELTNKIAIIGRPSTESPPMTMDQINTELKQLPSIPIEPPSRATIDGWMKFKYDSTCACCEHNRQINQAPDNIDELDASRTIWDRQQKLAEYARYWDYAALEAEITAAKKMEADIRIAFHANTRAMADLQIAQINEYLTLQKYKRFYDNGGITRSSWATWQDDLTRAQRRDILKANLNWLQCQLFTKYIRYNELSDIIQKCQESISIQQTKSKLEADLQSLELDVIARIEEWEKKVATVQEESRIAAIYKDTLVDFTNKYIEITYATIASRMNRMLSHISSDIFTAVDGDLLVNGIPIQFGSGFQKTIINVLIRIVFMKIMTKPLWRDQQIIDEGLFSSLDETHLYRFVNVFIPTIQTSGIKLILISHQAELLAKLGKTVTLHGITRIGPQIEPPKRVIKRNEMFTTKGRTTTCNACNAVIKGGVEHLQSQEHIQALTKIEIIP